MRQAHVARGLFAAIFTFWLFSPSQAQNPPQPLPILQATRIVPAEAASALPRDGTKLPAPAQPIFFSAQRAKDWLKLANKPDGRFVYGFLPALRTPMEGDNFLSQAGATFALARASRYFHDERGTAVARQAVLTLLMETALDAKDASVRYTAAPPEALNRLASHGWLILAIHELATPGKDLLDQADQLGNYLRRQQRADGALGVDGRSGAPTDLDVQNAGIALQAIICSHKQRPAAWKVEMLCKALRYYQPLWEQRKDFAAVVSLTPAYAEAYLVTREKAFADAVFAMNDWLLGLQYRTDQNAVRKHWLGGFQSFVAGKQELTAPDITSALPALSLAEACRVAKQAGDLPHVQHYERALLLNLHFVMSLQYTNAGVQHFVENYRPAILGAFHASHQNGDLRLDYTQHPLCAMVQYLDTVIE